MFEKSPRLLASMAMRASHDFGLKEPQERQQAMQEMSSIYDLYAKNFTDAQIAEKLSLSLVTVAQLREEVDGRGFFRN